MVEKKKGKEKMTNLTLTYENLATEKKETRILEENVDTPLFEMFVELKNLEKPKVCNKFVFSVVLRKLETEPTYKVAECGRIRLIPLNITSLLTDCSRCKLPLYIEKPGDFGEDVGGIFVSRCTKCKISYTCFAYPKTFL